MRFPRAGTLGPCARPTREWPTRSSRKRARYRRQQPPAAPPGRAPGAECYRKPSGAQRVLERCASWFVSSGHRNRGELIDAVRRHIVSIMTIISAPISTAIITTTISSSGIGSCNRKKKTNEKEKAGDEAIDAEGGELAEVEVVEVVVPAPAADARFSWPLASRRCGRRRSGSCLASPGARIRRSTVVELRPACAPHAMLTGASCAEAVRTESGTGCMPRGQVSGAGEHIPARMSLSREAVRATVMSRVRLSGRARCLRA